MKTEKIKLEDSYLNLIHEFPLRPIRNHSEYDLAVAVAQKLYMREETDLDAGERDYLDALDEFIAGYDGRCFSLGKVKQSPLERLKYVLDQSGTTPAGLQQILNCSQSLISMILSGGRELSKENIKTLAAHFKVEAGLFL